MIPYKLFLVMLIPVNIYASSASKHRVRFRSELVQAGIVCSGINTIHEEAKKEGPKRPATPMERPKPREDVESRLKKERKSSSRVPSIPETPAKK